MNSNELLNISPIDGRYTNQTKSLSTYFSEFSLLKWRLYVEIEYFILLFDKKIISDTSLDDTQRHKLKNIYNNFDIEEATLIKIIEKELNHDVKAVEYFLKEKINTVGLGEYKEFVHFGLTSQDINNTAIPLMIRKWFQNIYIVDFQH